MFRGGESAPIVTTIVVITIDRNFLVPSKILQSRTVGEPVDLAEVYVHDHDGVLTSINGISDCGPTVEFHCYRTLFVPDDLDRASDHECDENEPDEWLGVQTFCVEFFFHRNSPLQKERTLVSSIPKKIGCCQEDFKPGYMRITNGTNLRMLKFKILIHSYIGFIRNSHV